MLSYYIYFIFLFIFNAIYIQLWSSIGFGYFLSGSWPFRRGNLVIKMEDYAMVNYIIYLKICKAKLYSTKSSANKYPPALCMRPMTFLLSGISIHRLQCMSSSFLRRRMDWLESAMPKTGIRLSWGSWWLLLLRLLSSRNLMKGIELSLITENMEVKKFHICIFMFWVVNNLPGPLEHLNDLN